MFSCLICCVTGMQDRDSVSVEQPLSITTRIKHARGQGSLRGLGLKDWSTWPGGGHACFIVRARCKAVSQTDLTWLMSFKRTGFNGTSERFPENFMCNTRRASCTIKPTVKRQNVHQLVALKESLTVLDWTLNKVLLLEKVPGRNPLDLNKHWEHFSWESRALDKTLCASVDKTFVC